LKDSLKAAGVGPADAIFEGDLRKDVQLSSDLTFKLNAPLDLRSTGAQAAQAAQDIITLPNHHGVLPTPVSQ
jgi:hypothetical protein